MEKVEYRIGKNEVPLIGYLHEDLSAYCDTYSSRPALVVFPGGGYVRLSLREMDPVAFPFFAAGYQVFVLSYSVGEAIQNALPEDEGAEALKTIRLNAAKLKVDPEKIAVMGFSAGGHAALSVTCHWEKFGALSRPDAAILAYPVVTMGMFAHQGSMENLTHNDESLIRYYSLEKEVKSNTPPCFIWHTADDDSVPVMNALLLAQALTEKHVPYEMHIYPKGGHGLSTGRKEVGKEEKGVQSWIPLALSWLSDTLSFEL